MSGGQAPTDEPKEFEMNKMERMIEGLGIELDKAHEDHDKAAGKIRKISDGGLQTVEELKELREEVEWLTLVQKRVDRLGDQLEQLDKAAEDREMAELIALEEG